MESRKFKIVAESGIHARPATLLVQTATKFDSKITLTYDHKSVDLKSIMGVMSLGVGKGSKIVIKADGKDEKDAINDVSQAMKKEGLSD